MHWRIVGIHKNEWCYKYHWKTNKNRYGVYNLAYTILNRCVVASTSEENIDNWWLPPLLGRSLKRMEIWRQLKVLWSCWCISLVSSCRMGCSSCIGKPLMCPGFLMAVVVIHSLSHVRLGETPRTAACQASLSFTISHSLLKFISIESVMPSNLCHPCLSVMLTSSSGIPFSSCCPPFPASGSFPMSQPFAPGGQSIGVSASASVLPMNI